MRFLSSICSALSLLALPDLTAAHPTAEVSSLERRGPGICHTPTNRACWNGPYNINTDYEKVIPPGRVRKYNWDVTEVPNWVAPDGTVKEYAQLVAGKYPGPVLEADWGDYIEVTINNKLKYNGTSFHWHGIRQLKNNINDGANGVTECPIPPGSSKTYKFRAEQYGSSWYHSHYTAQYANGVIGSIVINGPASANYDIDLGAYPIHDLYADTADKIVSNVLAGNRPPNSVNLLFNGKNVNANGTKGEYSKLTFTPGKKHRIRLINPSGEHHYQISIVNHNLTVISTDLVPVKPLVTDNIFLGVGQRVDVIVQANKTPGNYWMNATMYASNACGASANAFPAAIMHYSNAPNALPTDKGVLPVDSLCMDRHDFEPIVKRTVPTRDFTPSRDNLLDITLVPPTTSQPFLLWNVNASSIRVQWDKPVLDYVLRGETNYPRSENLIMVNKRDAWTYWVIQNNSPLEHPMHLHGHDSYVLGASARNAGAFTAADIPSLKTDNPVRRDVAMVPRGGWLVLAFKSDNPGNWLFHCHIAWHISGGLGVDFMERVSEQSSQVSLTQRTQFNNECAKWNQYWDASGLSQPDSGLRGKPVGIPSGI
jgi:FtsP/CotA-like multicopper oxidase with cupredoxin domain